MCMSVCMCGRPLCLGPPPSGPVALWPATVLPLPVGALGPVFRAEDV